MAFPCDHTSSIEVLVDEDWMVLRDNLMDASFATVISEGDAYPVFKRSGYEPSEGDAAFLLYRYSAEHCSEIVSLLCGIEIEDSPVVYREVSDSSNDTGSAPSFRGH